MRRVVRPVLALLLAASTVTACSRSDEGGNSGAPTVAGARGSAARPGDAKLTQLLASREDLRQFNRIVASSGLGSVLDGVGPYTLFAPTDSALEGLGAGQVDALAGEQMRPQAAALLRAHIVPGTVTRRDLETALGNSRRGPVKMKTMAGGDLTFSREDGAIVVTSADGARARLAGEEEIGTNGAVQPVDGLLRRAQ